MKKLIAVLALGLFMVGCQPTTQRQPAVKVDRVERNNSATLKITYENHSGGGNCTPYVELQTLEQLRAYKDQLKFLLSQIEEAEKRMDQNEQK